MLAEVGLTAMLLTCMPMSGINERASNEELTDLVREP
eukprot:COSAG05_NODE_14571_length_393_cov_0.687075_1_plen_36_part_10